MDPYKLAMRWLLAAAGIGLLGLVLAGSFATKAPAAEITTQVYNPVAQLFEAKGTQDICTVFYIGNNTFISAGHCAHDPKKLVIKSDNAGGNKHVQYDVDAYIASPAGFAGSRDTSIFFVSGTDQVSDYMKPLAVNCNYSEAIGDKLTVIGFPEDMGRMQVDGEVAAKASPWKDNLWPSPVIRAALPITYGNSGSPVFHDGEVIGIAVGSLPDNRTLMVVEPIKFACRVLGLSPLAAK